MAGRPEEAVLRYLTDQNRPYSANDLVLNLHKEHGKAAVQKALDNLVVEGKVAEKVNGKQKAYVVNQNDLPTASEAELADLDARTKEVGAELKTRNEEVKAADARLKVLSGQPSDAEARRQIDALEERTSRLKERLEKLNDSRRQTTGGVLVKADKKNVEMSVDAAAREWRKRKRMCANVLDAILEGYPKPKKVLLEEVGIETDEEAGATVPDA